MERSLEERDAIIERHYEMADRCARKFKRLFHELTLAELRSSALYSLVLAARTWDERRGAFSTYFGKAFYRTALSEVQARYDVDSLDVPVRTRGDESILLIDTIPSEEDVAEDATVSEMLRWAMEKLTPRERETLELWVNGLPLAEIARRRGVSTSRIFEIKRKALKKVRRRIAVPERSIAVWRK